MLKEIKKNEIITLALSSGQEVIGKYIDESSTVITVEQPLTIAFGPEGAAFQPFTLTGNSDGKVEISKQLVITQLYAREETAKNYREATSGLIT